MLGQRLLRRRHGEPGSGRRPRVRSSPIATVEAVFRAGHPIPLPFFEDFEASPDRDIWIHQNGSIASSNGVNEPSGDRSLQLDATSNAYGDDEIRSNEILLGVPEAFHHYQHRGVESGECSSSNSSPRTATGI